MVSGLLLLVTLLGATPARPGALADTVGNGARRLLHEARVAVEGDSAPVFMAVWSARRPGRMGGTRRASRTAPSSAAGNNARSFR